jgi:hypothetical protein
VPALARDVQAHVMSALIIVRQPADVVVARARGGHAQHVARGAPDVVGMVMVAARAVRHRLQRHGVVELQGVGGWHRGPSADGVKETRQRGAPAGRRKRGGGRRSRGGAVCGGEDATSSVDHPIGHLAHAKARSMTQLFFLLLTGIRMIRVTMEPGLEVIGGLLGELAALTGGTIDEGRGRHIVWRTRGGGDGDVGGSWAQGGRVVRVSRWEDKVRGIFESPLALYP